MILFSPRKVAHFILISAVLIGFIAPAAALPVFPGAVGFGTDTSAGYYRSGGKTPVIYIVTSTDHASGTPSTSTRNGVSVRTGTLLQCLLHNPGTNVPKIILFEVSGTITATSSPYTYYIDYPYTTIAGQTAPSPGITLKNIHFRVRKAHDVLIQHIRSRVGDMANGEKPDERRAFSCSYVSGEDPYNIVFDHVSASWGVDINLGIGASRNVTVSNSIISEGLNDSLHSKGPHSKGFSSSRGAVNTFFYRNLSAHNKDRNPYLRAGKKVILNNIIYNPGDFNCIIQESGTGTDKGVHASIVNNLIIGGANSHSTAEELSPMLMPNLNSGSRFYLSGNKNVWGSSAYVQSGPSDWSHVRNSSGLSAGQLRITSPAIWVKDAEILNVNELENEIAAYAGARPADRDAVDIRIIKELKNRTGRMIDSPSDVGGWPTLAVNRRMLTVPKNPHSDQDGNGYTNIEEWIHGYALQASGGNVEVKPEPPFLMIVSSNP